jgi:hypothetical protein
VSSPYINRFLSPDTIVPGAGNPQAFNRYSYTLNNPLRYTDPSGHMQEDDDYNCHGCTLPPPCNNCGGGGNEDDNNNGGGGSSVEDFFSDIAYFADNVGAVTSDIEFIVVDTISVIVIVGGCSTGAGCLPALGYALAIDIGVSAFSPLGLVENVAGGVALSSTGIADLINETTYVHSNSNGGYDIGIGGDTVVSAVNAVAGLVPEANYDAWISNQQLEYDNQRRSEGLPAVSLFEFHVPQSLNLWGAGWPNNIP